MILRQVQLVRPVFKSYFIVFPYGALNQEPTRHLWTKLHQVHKCVAQVGITAEVHGKIHEIIELTEALFVQQGQEHVAGVVVGQVAQHHLSKSQDGVALRKFCVFVHCTMSSAPFGPCMYVFCDFFSSRTIQPQPCTLFHINYSCIFEAPWYVGLCCRTPHLSQPCLLSPATCIISENCRSHQSSRKKEEHLTFISLTKATPFNYYPLCGLCKLWHTQYKWGALSCFVHCATGQRWCTWLFDVVGWVAAGVFSCVSPESDSYNLNRKLEKRGEKGWQKLIETARNCKQLQVSCTGGVFAFSTSLLNLPGSYTSGTSKTPTRMLSDITRRSFRYWRIRHWSSKSRNDPFTTTLAPSQKARLSQVTSFCQVPPKKKLLCRKEFFRFWIAPKTVEKSNLEGA